MTDAGVVVSSWCVRRRGRLLPDEWRWFELSRASVVVKNFQSVSNRISARDLTALQGAAEPPVLVAEVGSLGFLGPPAALLSSQLTV
jgi:hypothetical protein